MHYNTITFCNLLHCEGTAVSIVSYTENHQTLPSFAVVFLYVQSCELFSRLQRAWDLTLWWLKCVHYFSFTVLNLPSQYPSLGSPSQNEQMTWRWTERKLISRLSLLTLGDRVIVRTKLILGLVVVCWWSGYLIDMPCRQHHWKLWECMVHFCFVWRRGIVGVTREGHITLIRSLCDYRSCRVCTVNSCKS